MSKREAKRWACELAAALLRSDAETCPDLDDDQPDSARKQAAMYELIAELERRGGSADE